MGEARPYENEMQGDPSGGEALGNQQPHLDKVSGQSWSVAPQMSGAFDAKDVAGSRAGSTHMAVHICVAEATTLLGETP
jgi:hypothetical protein